MPLNDIFQGNGAADSWNNYVHTQQTQKQQELKNQFDEANNPQLLQHQALMNKQGDADLQGKLYGNRVKSNEADQSDALQSGALALNQQKQQAQQRQQMGVGITQMAASLQQLPVMMQKQKAVEIAQQYGIDMSHADVQGLLNLPADKFLDGVSSYGKQLELSGVDSVAKLQAIADKNDAVERYKAANDASREKMNANTEDNKWRIANLQHEAMMAKIKAGGGEKGLQQTLTRLNNVPKAQQDAAWYEQYKSTLALIDFVKSETSAGTANTILSNESPTTKSTARERLLEKAKGADPTADYMAGKISQAEYAQRVSQAQAQPAASVSGQVPLPDAPPSQGGTEYLPQVKTPQPHQGDVVMKVTKEGRKVYGKPGSDKSTWYME